MSDRQGTTHEADERLVQRAAKEIATTQISDIDWNIGYPCADCPFLISSPYHEGVAGSLPEYVSAIDRGVFSHTCHKTDNREICDGARGSYKGDKPKHCAGALVMLHNTGEEATIQPYMTAVDRGWLNASKLGRMLFKMKSRAHTLDSFLKFYLKELTKRAP